MPFSISMFDVAEVVVGVSPCYLDYVRSKLPANIGVAAQNCYKADKGAFTGNNNFNN